MTHNDSRPAQDEKKRGTADGGSSGKKSVIGLKDAKAAIAGALEKGRAFFREKLSRHENSTAQERKESPERDDVVSAAVKEEEKKQEIQKNEARKPAVDKPETPKTDGTKRKVRYTDRVDSSESRPGRGRLSPQELAALISGEPVLTESDPPSAPEASHQPVREITKEEDRKTGGGLAGFLSGLSGSGKERQPKKSRSPIHSVSQGMVPRKPESGREKDGDKTEAVNRTMKPVLMLSLQHYRFRLAISLTAAILIYFIGFQMYSGMSVYARTEPAMISRYVETIDVEGISVRDEMIIDGRMTDNCVGAISNGERVSRGEAVVNVFPSAQDAAGYARIDELDREIAELSEIERAKDDSTDSVNNISRQLTASIVSLNADISEHNVSSVAEAKRNMSYMLNKRQVAMRLVEGYGERIRQLEAEKAALENKYKNSPQIIAAPEAGYYCDTPDGYENVLNTSMLETMTPEQLEEAMKKPENVRADSVGKIITDFTWYIVCPVPTEEAESLLVPGSLYNLYLPYSAAGKTQAVLERLNAGSSGTSLAVFRCSTLVSELCNLRRQPVRIQKLSYEGFVIKKTALHAGVKYHETKDGNGKVVATTKEVFPSVYVIAGKQVREKRVNILYSSGNTVICSKNMNGSEWLSQFDEVVTEGRGLYDGKIIE